MPYLSKIVLMVFILGGLVCGVQAAPPEKDICPAPEGKEARRAAVEAACHYFNGIPSGWGLHSAFNASGQVTTCIHFSCNPASKRDREQSQQQPAATIKRFRLNFEDAILVHQPGTNSLQITVQGNVLSYGNDWQVRQLKPYLFHFKQQVWKDFHWKVNTSRKEVYKVAGGQFGRLGGQDQKIDIGVEPVGDPNNPTRFKLQLHDAYLVHQVGRPGLQVAAQGSVLSYGKDWQVRQLKPYLFHLKQEVWKGFYWKVNTSRKEAYRVRGGKFGQLGGRETKLNMTVDPVY
jgi:hypothetical protein